MARKVLVVDDEKLIVKGIRFSLEQDGMEVDCAYDGQEALDYINKNKYDVILLDVMLPVLNGFEVCQQIREFSNVPVIMLTAKGDDMDKILGLEYGADDYITKPFSLAILRARVGAQLRRAKTVKQYKIEIDSYSFDFEKMEFKKDGTLIGLSKTEQKLLRLFVENRGVTLTRNFLVDRIWTDGEEYVDENALSVTVKRLRDKLDAGGYIKTVYGVGYVWKKQQVNAGKG